MATNSSKKKVEENEEEETPKNELAKITINELFPPGLSFEELSENLKEMSDVNFPRVRFRGGKFYFTNDASDKGVTEFEGVLLSWSQQNSYWSGRYDPQVKTPPDCFSVDGKVGSKPRDSDGRYGDCGTCELNKFKSSSNGKGKACRNQLCLYVQVTGNAIPFTLFLAPTSIGNFNPGYIINKVTQKGLIYFRILTKFSSFKKDGETFDRVNFEVAGNFPTEELAQVKQVRDFWLPAIQRDRTRLDTGDDHDSHGTPGKTQTQALPSSTQTKAPDKNVRTVTPRQAPAPVAAEDKVNNLADDEEPPF